MTDPALLVAEFALPAESLGRNSRNGGKQISSEEQEREHTPKVGLRIDGAVARKGHSPVRSEQTNGWKQAGTTLPFNFEFVLPSESIGRDSWSGGKQMSSREETDELDIALGDVVRITVALERVEA